MFYHKGHYQAHSELGVYLYACGNCYHGVCVEAPPAYLKPHSVTHGPYFESFFEYFPSPKPLDAPANTPDDVAKAYKTAMKNLRSGEDGDLEAACIMARRSIELAVNLMDAEGGNLKKKIDDLADKKILSPILQAWAHEIRDIGNDGAHEPDVSREDAEQAVYFAEMLFTYLFTLPGMIAERRCKADQQA